ncbi:MAG: arginase [Alphaproteobacteria bacterium]|nr:arginase [Alphaproteobacteria bacterium]
MTLIHDPELFRTVGTYLGVPQTWDLAGARAAIVGLPFDTGRHPRRVGARNGPAAIRAMSTDNVRRYRPELAQPFDPVAALGLVDCGDVPLRPGDVDDAIERGARAIARVVGAGAVPLGLGGDGLTSLPVIKAVAARHPGLCVLHFDSHTDAYPDPAGGNRIQVDPATTFAHAADQGWVDARRSLHVGMRGLTYVPGVFAYTEGLGYGVVTMDTARALGAEAFAARVRALMGERPVYLCFDMDVFDPSVAPGVYTPAWGGFSAAEGLAFVRALAGLDIVGCDVNTTSPDYDVQGLTAWLAATVVYEVLWLLCVRFGLAPR